jgi:NAD(P)-dependent dehydrogenase (short-subunit alcohol dehydrogenase family)
MSYLVTGATGFIGRYLVRELVAQGHPGAIYVLVRNGSKAALAELYRWWNVRDDEVIAIEGDLGLPQCGVSSRDQERMRGQVRHFFHLGAIYDLNASASALENANVAGTRHALELAESLLAGCFHLCSSIAVAGRYRGVFTESMFEEAYGLDHAYFRTKHESEAIVRDQTRVPWRIYRPGMVVGDSTTGHSTKSDGPYLLFKTLQVLRRTLPSWLPTIGIEGGYVNIVPVDYVTRSIVHLAHLDDLNGRCFHLTDPQPRHAGEVANLFAHAGHAPLMGVRLDAKLLRMIPLAITDAFTQHAPLRAVIEQVLDDLQLPRAVLEFFDLPTLFDNAATRSLLEKAGIRLPPLEDYAWRLWDYWERHLDPELSLDRSLSGAIKGKRVLITGGSSGIGRATALRLAQAGAHVLIVARDAAKLQAVQTEILALKGRISIYPCDITDAAACQQLVTDILDDVGGIDVLINNAGHSIRRSIAISYERLHDFERLMQLNYFAAVRLTLAFMPHMVAQGGGHVIVISSIGVLSNAPRFAAYVASKAALEAFTRCASSEYRDERVSFTVVNMPLVHTPMTAPTHAYDDMHLLSAQEAAMLVAEAIIHKPPRLVSRLGVFAQLMEAFAPRFADVINNANFHMFPDSAAAKGSNVTEEPPTKEALAFANLLKGLHW